MKDLKNSNCSDSRTENHKMKGMVMSLQLTAPEDMNSANLDNTEIPDNLTEEAIFKSKKNYGFHEENSAEFSESQFEVNILIHDLNNQLALVMGAIEMILMKYEDDIYLQHELDKIKKSLLSASSLIQFTLRAGRKAYQTAKKISLHQLLTELADSLSLSSEIIDVRLNLKAAMSCIRGNRVQLENAFLNLAKNAIEAMPNGGILTFETDLAAFDCTKFRNSSLIGRSSYFLIVKIRDTGSGIKSEYQDLVFNRYFTTKNKNKGTGLGLASVSSIIKNHSGHIEFHSAVGIGTVFQITLPLFCPLAISEYKKTG